MKKIITFYISILIVFCGINGCSKSNPTSPIIPILIEYSWVDNSPSWSPDGNYIAYEHRPNDGSGNEIWILNLSDMSKTYLCKGMLPDWSPDGKWLLFCWPPYGLNELYIIKPNGDSLRLITDSGGTYPHWLPDGKRISFFRGGLPDSAFLWIIDANTGQRLRSIKTNGAVDWSPDASRIVISQGYSPSPPLERIVITDSLGNNQVVLYGDSTTNTNRFPTWSPLNNYVAFSSNPSSDHEWNGTDGGALSQIFIVNVNNYSSIKLTTEGGEYPSWSPDGNKISYCRFNPWVNPLTDSRNGRLWLMNVDGTNKQQITFP